MESVALVLEQIFPCEGPNGERIELKNHNLVHTYSPLALSCPTKGLGRMEVWWLLLALARITAAINYWDTCVS